MTHKPPRSDVRRRPYLLLSFLLLVGCSHTPGFGNLKAVPKVSSAASLGAPLVRIVGKATTAKNRAELHLAAIGLFDVLHRAENVEVSPPLERTPDLTVWSLDAGFGGSASDAREAGATHVLVVDVSPKDGKKAGRLKLTLQTLHGDELWQKGQAFASARDVLAATDSLGPSLVAVLGGAAQKSQRSTDSDERHEALAKAVGTQQIRAGQRHSLTRLAKRTEPGAVPSRIQRLAAMVLGVGDSTGSGSAARSPAIAYPTDAKEVRQALTRAAKAKRHQVAGIEAAQTLVRLLEKTRPRSDRWRSSVDLLQRTIVVAEVPETVSSGTGRPNWFKDHRLSDSGIVLAEALDADPGLATIVDPGGFTLLHNAADHGREDRAATLLEHGAAVDTRGRLGQTALHRAAWRGHERIVAGLLKAGADARARDAFAQTPLHLAVWNGDGATIRRLLAVGSGLESRNELLETPLIVAAAVGNRQAVRILLDAGARQDVLDGRYRTALERTLVHRRIATMKTLLSHRRPPTPRHIQAVAKRAVGTDRSGQLGMLAVALGKGPLLNELLFVAAAKASTSDIHAMIAAGADPHATHDEGRFPIERAVSAKNLASVSALAGFPGDSAAFPAHQRPIDMGLVAAVGNGWRKGVSRLFELGAAPQARSRDGAPLAVVAVERLRSEGEPMLQLLAASSVPLSAQDSSGDTALHHAASLGVLVQSLVKLGLDVNVPARDGTRPLWAAMSVGRTVTAKLLLSLGAKAGLHTSAGLGRLDLLKKALGTAGATPDAYDRRGWTALHWGVRHGGKAVVVALLKAGASATAVSKDGKANTPMHFAAERRDRTLVKLLLRAGAKGDLKNSKGRTAKVIWPGGFSESDRGMQKGNLSGAFSGTGGKAAASMRHPGRAVGSAAFRRRDVALDLLDIAAGPRPLSDIGSVDIGARFAKELVAMGHYRVAHRMYEDVGAMVAKGEPRGYRHFAVLNNIGRVSTFRGNLPQATRALKAAKVGMNGLHEAAGSRKSLGESPSPHEIFKWREAGRRRGAALRMAKHGLSFATSNLGHLAAIAGQPDKAVALFRSVLELRKKNAPKAQVAASYEDLGLALMDVGQYRLAHAAFDDAQKLLGKGRGWRQRLAGLSLNRGELHRRVGKLVDARKAAQAVVTMMSATPPNGDDYGLLAAAHIALAELSSRGSAAKRAQRHYNAAMTALEKGYGGAHDLVPVARVGLARTEAALASGNGKTIDDAIERAKTSIATLYGADHPAMADVLVIQASRTSGHSDALKLLEDAVFLADSGAVVGLQWSARVALGERLVAAGRTNSAIFIFKQAVQALEMVRKRTPVRWQQRFVDDKAPTYRRLASLLVDKGRLAQAQDVLSKLKREELASFTLRSAPGKAAAVFGAGEGGVAKAFTQMRERVGELSQKRAALRAIRDQRVLNEEEKATLKELRAQLRVVRRAFAEKLAGLEKELAAQGREDRSLRSLRALQGTLARLDASAVALHYVVAKERLHIILTTSEVQVAETVAVTPVALNRKVAALRKALANPDSDAAVPAKAVYDLVLGPIAKDLVRVGAKTLLVAPDGVLRYVPFAALHDGSRYVVERYSTVSFTDASRDKLGRATAKGKTSVAGLGVSAKLGEFSALPSVPKELHGIVISDAADTDGVLPGVVKLDKAFDIDALRGALDDGHAVLHLATHFELRPGTVKDSFLLLGDGAHLSLDSIKYDDFDFRNVDLLTLSACNTGMGISSELNSGREVEGFGALAQNLGAKSVIATLWPVADESTGLFMQQFYKLRASPAGVSKAEAMRRIQVKLLRGSIKSAEQPDIEDPFSHPFFWAPFILLGDWL